MMFAALAAILYVISIAMIVIGGYVAADGSQMFPADRAVAQYIAGLGVATGGCVLFGIATLILCLGFLNRTLQKARTMAPVINTGAPDEAEPVAVPAMAAATAAAAVAVAPVVRDKAGETYAFGRETGLLRTQPEDEMKPAQDETPATQSGKTIVDPLEEKAAPDFAEREKDSGTPMRDSDFGYSYAPVPPAPLPSLHRFPAMADDTVEAVVPAPAVLESEREKIPAAEMPAEVETVAEEIFPAVGKAKAAPAVVGSYESGGNRYVMYADGSIEAHLPGGLRVFQSLDELKQFIATGSPS